MVDQTNSRQIMVYGEAAQGKLGSSHVLVSGASGMLAREIVKNLVLSGVGKLTLIEATAAEDNDVPPEHNLMSFARKLRPLVDISAVSFASVQDMCMLLHEKGDPVDGVVDCGADLHPYSSTAPLISFTSFYSNASYLPYIGCNTCGGCGYVVSSKVSPIDSYVHCTGADGPMLRLCANKVGSGMGYNDRYLAMNDCWTTAKNELYNAVLSVAIRKSQQRLCERTNRRHQSGRAVVNSIPSCNQLYDDVVRGFLKLNNTLPREELLLLLNQKEKDAVDYVISGFYSSCMSEAGNRTCTNIEDGAMSSVIGAFASQDMILQLIQQGNAAVDTYCEPIRKVRLFEAFDSFSDVENTPSHSGTEKPHVTTPFRIFIVGMGAIGCEVLKTISLMDLPTERPVHIIMADGDLIESSNLNRQLLFSQEDIGRPKAVVAHETITSSLYEGMKRSNVPITFESHVMKVDIDSEKMFNQTFWQGLDVVVSALDNVEARRYVNDKCVMHSKCLLDGGTLGLLGSTQAIIANVSESYTASVDPVTAEVPVCTIKTFPFTTEHCILWGKSTFLDVYFTEPMESMSHTQPQVKTKEILYASSRRQALLKCALYLNAVRDSNMTVTMARKVNAVITRIAVQWGLELYESLFVKEIEQLYKLHPRHEVVNEYGTNGIGVDKKHNITYEDDNSPKDADPLDYFWDGCVHRPPIIRPFDKLDPEHQRLVESAAFVFLSLLPQPEEHNGDGDWLSSFSNLVEKEILSMKESDSWNVDCDITYCSNGAKSNSLCSIEAIKNVLLSISQTELEESIYTVGDKLIRWVDDIPVDFNVAPRQIEFEKDSVELLHIDLIASLSALRSHMYQLPVADRIEVHKVAGNIIPAVATTTSLVAGLVCLELKKLLLDDRSDVYFADSFVNRTNGKKQALISQRRCAKASTVVPTKVTSSSPLSLYEIKQRSIGYLDKSTWLARLSYPLKYGFNWLKRSWDKRNGYGKRKITSGKFLMHNSIKRRKTLDGQRNGMSTRVPFLSRFFSISREKSVLSKRIVKRPPSNVVQHSDSFKKSSTHRLNRSTSNYRTLAQQEQLMLLEYSQCMEPRVARYRNYYADLKTGTLSYTEPFIAEPVVLTDVDKSSAVYSEWSYLQLPFCLHNNSVLDVVGYLEQKYDVKVLSVGLMSGSGLDSTNEKSEEDSSGLMYTSYGPSTPSSPPVHDPLKEPMMSHPQLTKLTSDHIDLHIVATASGKILRRTPSLSDSEGSLYVDPSCEFWSKW